MSVDTLNICRRKLNEALGDKSTKYFNHMKQWFRMKLTKEEFDTEARSLLSLDQVRYHNEFLLALLNKVEGLAETSITIARDKAISHNRNSRRHKRSSRTSEKSNFEPADLLEYLPPNSPPGAGSDGVKYAAQEIFLPDHALVVGRFMLAAWELGLEGADDDAADIIVVAVQNFLKNIITAVISQRKGGSSKQNLGPHICCIKCIKKLTDWRKGSRHTPFAIHMIWTEPRDHVSDCYFCLTPIKAINPRYKLRNKRFMYDLGGDTPNMWLRNSSLLYDPQSDGRVDLDDSVDALGPRCPPTIDEVEQSTAFEIACSGPSTEPNDDKLTIEEFYNTLLTHKNVIACHSVYAVNMERLAVMLNHPSY